MDGAAMAEMLRGPNGPVARDLIRRGDRVIEAARHQIGHDGPLAKSIVKRFTSSPLGLGLLIIAGIGLDPGYAYWVHEGNGPPGGRIYPTSGKVLAFEINGETVFARSVKTSTPNRYLSDNIKAAAG
jgi:hypothetical protein